MVDGGHSREPKKCVRKSGTAIEEIGLIHSVHLLFQNNDIQCIAKSIIACCCQLLPVVRHLKPAHLKESFNRFCWQFWLTAAFPRWQIRHFKLLQGYFANRRAPHPRRRRPTLPITAINTILNFKNRQTKQFSTTQAQNESTNKVT